MSTTYKQTQVIIFAVLASMCFLSQYECQYAFLRSDWKLYADYSSDNVGRLNSFGRSQLKSAAFAQATAQGLWVSGQHTELDTIFTEVKWVYKHWGWPSWSDCCGYWLPNFW